jgi:hypothetical protein
MVEMVGICQVRWYVMVESTKDRLIGVDTPEQQVPPRVQYGMTCLLMVWDPLLTRWYGWEWDGFGLACVELYDL